MLLGLRRMIRGLCGLSFEIRLRNQYLSILHTKSNPADLGGGGGHGSLGLTLFNATTFFLGALGLLRYHGFKSYTAILFKISPTQQLQSLYSLVNPDILLQR
jgi:hypothetical protein